MEVACTKERESFCTSHSNICILLALRGFSDGFPSIKGRNGFKITNTTYYNTNNPNCRTRESSGKCISYMKYICESRPKPLGLVTNF